MASVGQKREAPSVLEEDVGQPESSAQNGDVKRQKSMPASDTVTYRLLCPGNRTGSIIGKGGEIIRQLRHETNTKIKIEDVTVPCEDRVVSVTGSNGSGPDSPSSPMQDALIRVFARIVDADKSEHDPGQMFMARLMLLPPQIGSIMGKGGRTISQIRRESGTNIRILQPGDMPPCAMAVEPHAQLVQVTGGVQNVQSGLANVCMQLRINPGKAWVEPVVGPPMHRPPMPGGPQGFNPGAPPFMPSRGPGPTRRAARGPAHGSAPGPMPSNPGGKEQDVEVGYRLLLPVQHVGGLIGRGGEAIADIRHRTHARVKVHEAHDTSEQRVVSISGREAASATVSPAAEALVLCAAPILQEEGDLQKVVRLVVPSSQVGCVLGKQGSIVTRIRDSTGAMVRVLEQNKGQRRLDTGEEVDEVIELQGSAGSCDAALHAAAKLLRDYQVRITLRNRTSLPQRAPASPAYAAPYNPSAPYDPNPPPAIMPYAEPGYASYPPPDMAMPVHQPPPPAYPNPHAYAPAPQQQPPHQQMYQPAYEPVADPSQAQVAYDPSQQQYGGAYDPAAPPQMAAPYDPNQQVPYQAVYEPQPAMTAYAPPPAVGLLTTEPDGSSRIQLAIVGPQVGAVLGRNGANISQIRAISGAKVRLHEAPQDAPRTAVSQALVERQLDISGALGQVQSAVHLVQAFMKAGNVPALNIPEI